MHHAATADRDYAVGQSVSGTKTVWSATDAIRPAGRASKFLALCASTMVAFHAAQASAEPRLTQEQTARIRDICANTMRLQQGEVHFDACVSALSGSFALRLGVHVIKANRASCEEIGLKPDTPEFDVCVVRLENRQESPTRNTVKAVSTTALEEILPAEPEAVDQGKASPTDTHSSPRTRFARARLSCAQLGLDPQSSAFGVCAANLDSALFALDHENN